MSVDDVDLVTPDDDGASRAAREGRDLAVLANSLERGVEVVDLVQRTDFGLVGEQDVDVALDELEEGAPVAVHAKRIGQRERDDAPAVVRDRRRHPERLLGPGRIEQIALEVEDLSPGNQPGVDVVRAERYGGSEKGPHRALSVRRDHDQAAARGRSIGGWRRIVFDA